MRVISGKAKGRKLKMVPGDTTRPILDRHKESLFNILGPFVRNSHWLDLFAGTGQVGIEALSRGAESVVFIDLARQAVRTIQDNLRTTQLTDGAQVLQTDALGYLNRQAKADEAAFDVIYIAPPQYKRLWVDALTLVDQQLDSLLVDDGLVIVQIDPKEAEEVALDHLTLTDERKYGRTMFLFYERD